MTKNVRISEDIEEFLKKDFSKNEEALEKSASINWDGKNFLIRIPKDISRMVGLTEKNVLEKKILFTIKVDKNGNESKTFDIIKREEPKRETKKKHGK
jgi:hypothetical protein